jgi:hypothetical protein
MSIETAIHFYAWIGLTIIGFTTLLLLAVFIMELWLQLITKWAEYDKLLYATLIICNLKYHKSINKEWRKYAAMFLKIRFDMLKSEDEKLWVEFMNTIKTDDSKTPITERVLSEVFNFTFSDVATAELIKTSWQEKGMRFTLIAHVLEANDNDEFKLIMELETTDIAPTTEGGLVEREKYSAYLPMEYTTQEQLQQLIDGLSAGQVADKMGI